MTDTPQRVTPVRCHICAALIPDLPDDRRLHVGGHQSDRKAFDSLRRQLVDTKEAAATAADEARQIRIRLEEQIDTLRARVNELTDRDDDLDDGGLAINAWPEDEIDDQPESTYVDDITPPATAEEPSKGEPAEHPTDSSSYFYAIDRDDVNA